MEIHGVEVSLANQDLWQNPTCEEAKSIEGLARPWLPIETNTRSNHQHAQGSKW